MLHYITFLVFAPLIITPFLGFFVAKGSGGSFMKFTTISSVGIAFFASLVLFCGIHFYHVHGFNVHLLDWISFESFQSSWDFKVDQVSTIMLVVITGVSFLVHIYSLEYMKEDPALNRFMTCLTVFTFFMVMLVVSNNLLQVFFGWEGVGLASYLLIGFWFKKDSANAASIKAFVANRVGDLGLIVGLCAIYYVFGSFEFDEILHHIPHHAKEIHLAGFEFDAISFICFCLFVGCMGKSAQLGLHVWLPDAMEGPTPVSALIHAATMVTAGVFLLARCSFLFEHAESVLHFIAVIGSLTAIFAATIAVTQSDIKKIIAYSTCSQLGYMMFACGLSQYNIAMFHLFTHAFFKALLFLGAGAVIHAAHHEQNIFKMGGFAAKMPVTYIIFLIGTLAICGIYPFAGYFSKDLIIEMAYLDESAFGKFAYISGILAALLTSFYSWRLIFIVFHGKTRASAGVYGHLKDQNFTMNFPLYILAICSVVIGFIGVKFWHINGAEFWNHSIFVHHGDHHHVPALVKFSPLIVSSIGFVSAFIIFYLLPKKNVNLSPKGIFLSVWKFLQNKYYIDELYDLIFVRSIAKLSRISQVIDKYIIDFSIPHLGVNFAQFASTVNNTYQKLRMKLLLLIGFSSIILYSYYITYY